MGIERMGLEGAPEINRIQNNIQNQNEKRNVAAATAAERYSPCTPSSGGEGGSANMNMNMGMAAAMDGVPATFPAGLRVLVVDDDPICLKILDKMLRTCSYEVTTCSQATLALSLLRERKGGFDLVISDVYMPDMDGFKLLELIGLEMDLPVIMMSADGETSLVMKGIRHGACDYLLKPVRIEALKTIWQHVIRKRQNELKEVEHSESMEDGDRHRKVSDELEYASSMNEGNSSGLWKNNTKKRKDSKEDDDEGEQENDDSSTLKKPRVVWSVELHQEFVRAVNHLGIDKAVPKRILELMNVQGLTRENVASHLQKYRLYLKKLTGAGPQQSGFNSSFGGSTDINFGSIPSFDRHDLAAALPSPAGQMQRPQSLGGPFQGAHMNGNDATAGFDMPFLLQPPDLQNLNNNLQDRLRFGKQSLSNSEKNYLPGFPDLKHLQSSYQQHLSPYGSAAAQQQHQHHHLGSPASAANGARVFNQFNLLSVQMIHPQQQQQNHHALLQRHLGQHQQQSVARDQSEAGTNGLQILNIPPISMLNPPPPPPPPHHMIQTDAMGSIPNPCSLPNTNGFVASAGHLHHLPTSMAQSNEAAVTAAVSSEIQNHHNGYSHSRPPPLMGLSNCRDLNLPTGRTVSSSAGGGGMPEIEDSQSLENPGAVYNATAAANGYEHTERRWHLPSNVPNSAAAATDLQHAEASNNAGMIIEAQARDPKPKLQDEQLVDNHLADEAASSLMGNSDLDSRFPEPQFDDIISVLKQHQEDEAFSEGKFANGMYQLDASRMK